MDASQPQQHAQQLKLYSYWRSSCSWRVRIALAYKGIPYEYIPVNLAEGKQFTAEFKELNPSATVPVLEDNGLVVSESVAILEYLEEKYPEPSLFPVDLKRKALVRQVVNMIVASIQPLQNLAVLKRVEAKWGSEERLQWAQYFVERGFDALEAIIQRESGKFSIGDDFTLADVVLVPQIGNAARFNVDMAKFPVLKRIGEDVRGLPWVEASSPERQLDAVG